MEANVKYAVNLKFMLELLVICM